MTPEALSGGFKVPPIQSARAFRALLEAMARPGSLWQVDGALPPRPLSVAAGVTLLTLADGTTPVHLAGALDCPAVRDWIRFHTGAPLCIAEDAALAVGNWGELQPVGRFKIGTPDYPDRSATLIVEMPLLIGQGQRLRGPGIRDEVQLSLPETRAFQANHALFPLGFDCVLTCADRLAALPRSSIVEDN